YNLLLHKYSRVWANCQACSGSKFDKAKCMSSDCPVYFARVQVRRDIEDTLAQMDGFKEWKW
ncbi:hypothetical protein KIPB_011941, partial [Kipferlia bialata]